jgi:hypothetical protein
MSDPHPEIFSPTKEGNSAIWDNINEHGGHYVK